MKKSTFQSLGIIILFIFISGYFLVTTAPAWLLGNTIFKVSKNKLYMNDAQGTLWAGKGLLMIRGEKQQGDTPIITVKWKTKFGFKELFNITFLNNTDTVVGTLSIDNKFNINLSHLNLDLSLVQITKLYSMVSDFGLAGKVNLSADKIVIGKTNSGSMNISLDNLVSNLAPVNPIGSYSANLDLTSGSINISTQYGSKLNLSGTGNLNDHLNLIAKPSDENKETLTTLLTFMGTANPDGSYNMKVF